MGKVSPEGETSSLLRRESFCLLLGEIKSIIGLRKYIFMQEHEKRSLSLNLPFNMCGITGFIDFSKHSSRETLVAMRETLRHRGPDDKGEELIDTGAALVGLGFRRLSIIDLSPKGHQPMVCLLYTSD